MGLPGDAFQVKSQRNYFFFIKIEKEKKKQQPADLCIFLILCFENPRSSLD